MRKKNAHEKALFSISREIFFSVLCGCLLILFHEWRRIVIRGCQISSVISSSRLEDLINLNPPMSFQLYRDKASRLACCVSVACFRQTDLLAYCLLLVIVTIPPGHNRNYIADIFFPRNTNHIFISPLATALSQERFTNIDAVDA